MKTLLIAPKLLKLDRIVSSTGHITLFIHPTQNRVCCPQCRQFTTRIHSRYERTLADLPWEGVAVQIKLQTRRFFCRNDDCRLKIFCERMPELAARYARKTTRLNETLRLLGLMVGGEVGARIADELGLKVSPDTLLRRIRAAVLPEPQNPRVIGVDDWAKRKGQRYGTILVDLERHRVIDLLPDRESDTLAEWLKQHPGVEIISRDRAGAYAEGARKGAPQAIQIADRWHILKNLTEAVERFLQTKHSCLRDAAQQMSEPIRAETPATSEAQNNQNSTKLALWNMRRQQRYEEVRRLWQQGATINAIAEHLKMHRRTIRMFIRVESCPERLKPRKRPSRLDPYIDYLAQRWAEGCHSAAELHRELLNKGFQGCESLIRRFVRQWRSQLPQKLRRVRRGPPTAKPAISRRNQIVPSPRNTAWLLLQKSEKLEAEQQSYLNRVCEMSPEIGDLQKLAQRFSRIIIEKRSEEFSAWLEEASNSAYKEMKSFATGIQRDQKAVEAALKYSWSNGQTEGQINRLKNLKRQMYGRAKFDLLKVRVLSKS